MTYTETAKSIAHNFGNTLSNHQRPLNEVKEPGIFSCITATSLNHKPPSSKEKEGWEITTLTSALDRRAFASEEEEM
jgi:hypothetical protein